MAIRIAELCEITLTGEKVDTLSDVDPQGCVIGLVREQDGEEKAFYCDDATSPDWTHICVDSVAEILPVAMGKRLRDEDDFDHPVLCQVKADGDLQRGLVWSPVREPLLLVPPSGSEHLSCVPMSINSAGDVVGYVTGEELSSRRACSWYRGTGVAEYVHRGLDGYTNSWFMYISLNQEAVGWATTTEGQVVPFWFKFFEKYARPIDAGELQGPGCLMIDDSGLVLGTLRDKSQTRTSYYWEDRYWTPKRLHPPYERFADSAPANVSTLADGFVIAVGTVWTRTGQRRGFYFRRGGPEIGKGEREIVDLGFFDSPVGGSEILSVRSCGRNNIIGEARRGGKTFPFFARLTS